MTPRTPTFSDAESAERDARPFTDEELQRLRHEPFAPLWSSLAGLVTRFLATLDKCREDESGYVGPVLWWCPAWSTLNATRYHGNGEPDDPNCGKVAYRRVAP